MSMYGVKCEELAKQIAQLVSDADAAGIADVDILEALQTMQDDFGEKQMRAEIERTTTRFEARIVSAIQEAEKEGMGLRSIHAGLVAVTQRLVQRCDTRPWTEEWRKQRDASAASPMPEDNKAASAAIVKAYGKNGG